MNDQAVMENPVAKPIENLRDYFDWASEMMANTRVTLFRGQSQKGNLLPSIARKTPEFDTTTLERTMLDQFKLMGASMLLGVENSSLQLMVLAQHYGLKTRLLDWSGNPLAALYFACASSRSGDVHVYALRADDLISTDAYDKDPFSTQKTRVFQPPLNNPRIIVQQGWFTLHKYSDENKSFISLEKSKDTMGAITELVVPEQARAGLVSSLSKYGIGSHTLFPDLGGLSQHLNYIHSA